MRSCKTFFGTVQTKERKKALGEFNPILISGESKLFEKLACFLFLFYISS
jgi:hypothetical protein